MDERSRAFLLAQAHQFAREGRYSDADRVLHEFGEGGASDPHVLDLLARMSAQRGELDDADEYWSRAQQAGAGWSGPRDGRRKIATIRARRRRRATAARATGVVVLAVLLVGAGMAGSALTWPQDGDDPVRAELQRMREAQGDLSRQVDALRDEVGRETLRQDRLRGELTAALAGTPLLVRPEQGELVVTFPSGLFPSGAELSTQGEEALADLARRLRPFAARAGLTVVGHSDDIPVSASSRYEDNVDIALTRAREAATALSDHSGLPLAEFAIASSGSADPPFPNTTSEDRQRNRTVTVRLRPL